MVVFSNPNELFARLSCGVTEFWGILEGKLVVFSNPNELFARWITQRSRSKCHKDFELWVSIVLVMVSGGSWEVLRGLGRPRWWVPEFGHRGCGGGCAMVGPSLALFLLGGECSSSLLGAH